MAQVLIADRNETWRQLLQEILSADHSVEIWEEGPGSLELLERKMYDVAIVDRRAADSNGHRLLDDIAKRSPETVVIMISDGMETRDVVEAMRKGAFDYVVKPFSAEKIRSTVEQALETRALRYEIDYLRRGQDVIYDVNRIIAVSPAMQQVIKLILRVAQTDSTVLMTGETGTGKSFLAGTIHFNSQRARRPFIKINCANMPDTLLDSEFFGHEQGAFTGATKRRVGRFEQANGGTVFLDEIAEISPKLQAKLLRVLEDREFERLGGNKTIKIDVRIIAATNKSLVEEIEKGRFREDLYYRVNVLNIHLPALRERIEDIEPLAYYFLDRHCRNLKKKTQGFSDAALNALRGHKWPGNIRQLSNILERAVLLTDSPVLDVQNIALGTAPAPVRADVESNPEESIRSGKRVFSLSENERHLIVDALEKNLWIQKDAAKELGISRRVLNYKIKKLAIRHPRWRKNI